MKGLLRELFIHFLLLAAALFGDSAVLNRDKEPAPDESVVSAGQAKR